MEGMDLFLLCRRLSSKTQGKGDEWVEGGACFSDQNCTPIKE